LSWEALATRNTNLLKKSIKAVPKKPRNTTWINYARCHDDIGLGFDDKLVAELGLDSLQHRLYILKHYCDGFNGSFALGERFMIEHETGNARISGSMAALCGFEKALKENNQEQIQLAIKRINLQHAVILSLGGLPMIYSGDEVALLNNYDYINDESKKYDNRWLHRSKMDWSLVENIEDSSSAQAQVYKQLKQLIEIRKQTPAFADNNDLEFIDYENTHLLVYKKTDSKGEEIFVIANFSEFNTVFERSLFADFSGDKMYNLLTGTDIEIHQENFISAYDVLWLRKS
jgi:amylosucrase